MKLKNILRYVPILGMMVVKPRSQTRAWETYQLLSCAAGLIIVFSIPGGVWLIGSACVVVGFGLAAIFK